MNPIEPNLEQRFLDFRRSGDPSLLAAVFDAASPELLAIARRAVQDPLDAEDIVQATFLTALQKADRFRAGEPLMPWLVGILRNHVHKQRSRRAVDVVRLVHATVSAPDDDAAASEVLQAVRAAIAGLPQTYRTTLSLKLLHGLTATQIAEATGDTVGAVRARVHRGLAMLRAALPQGLAGVLAAVFPAIGLSTLRAQVLSVAPDAAAKVAGATVMKHSLFVVAGALVLLLAVVSGLTDGRRAVPKSEATVQTALTSTLTAAPAVMAGAPPPDRTILSIPGATPGDAAGQAHRAIGAVRVTVVDGNSKGVPSVSVRLVDPDGGDALVHGRFATTGPEGEALFRELPIGRYEVRLDRRIVSDQDKPSDRAHRWTAGTCDVTADAIAEARFRIADGLTVDGIVVDASGTPVQGADIWCAPFTAPPHPAELVATSDAAGRFRLHGVGGEHWICARAAGHGPSRTFSPWQATDAVMRSSTLRLELARTGGTVTGHVLDTAGRPVAHASVLIGSALFRSGSSYGESGIWADQPAPALLRTDEAGAFTLRCVATGKCPVRAWSPDHPPVEVEVDVTADAVTSMRIVLQSGFSLSGRVLDQKGAPVGGAHVRLGDADDAPVVWSDAQGIYRARGLEPGALHVTVTAGPARNVDATVAGEPGAAVSRDFTVPDAGLCHGQVRASDGACLAGWKVTAASESEAPALQARTDAAGRFEIACDPSVLYRLSLRSPRVDGASPRNIDCTWIGLVSGADRNPLTITLPEGLIELASVTGRCLDAAGRPLSGGIRAMTAGGEFRSYAPLAADGTFRIGPMLPCSLRLAVDPDDEQRPSWSLGEHALRSGVLQLGELRQPPAGSVHLTVIASGKQAIHAYVRDKQGTIVTMLTCAADGTCRTGLAVGDYTVEAFGLGTFGHGGAPVDRSFRVTEGQEQSVRIDLP